MNESINHKGVCKTAPATPGLCCNVNVAQFLDVIMDLAYDFEPCYKQQSYDPLLGNSVLYVLIVR